MRSLILLALLCAFGFAPAPFPKRERRTEPNVSLEGKWDFTLWQRNGSASPASQYLEFTADKVDFVSIMGGSKVTYKMIVRPELSPRAFHWQPESGGWTGSYRIEGDKLILIFNTGGSIATRPTDFNGKYEYRFELKRKR